MMRCAQLLWRCRSGLLADEKPGLARGPNRSLLHRGLGRVDLLHGWRGEAIGDAARTAHAADPARRTSDLTPELLRDRHDRPHREGACSVSGRNSADLIS